MFEAVEATPPKLGMPTVSAEFLQATCLAVCTTVYWRIRHNLHNKGDPIGGTDGRRARRAKFLANLGADG